MSQRVYSELVALSHTVKVTLAITDAAMEDAAKSFSPDLILCPFLKRRIPRSVWEKYNCIIIHPGITGDRGPSSLDWAIQNGDKYWGVTAIQASNEMDAGDIWASRKFSMELRSKASIYRQEVCDAALQCISDVIINHKDSKFRARSLNYNDKDIVGKLLPTIKQSDRSIKWEKENSEQIIRKIHAADMHAPTNSETFTNNCFLESNATIVA